MPHRTVLSWALKVDLSLFSLIFLIRQISDITEIVSLAAAFLVLLGAGRRTYREFKKK